MAFKNWNSVAHSDGGGATKDTVLAGEAEYEIIISSILIVNNSAGSASVDIHLTDSSDVVYFEWTISIAAGETQMYDHKICLNAQDKLKYTADDTAVSIVVSGDYTYTAA